MITKLKTYLASFQNLLLLGIETRLIYSQKAAMLRAIDPKLKKESDVEIVADALNTVYMIRALGYDNDAELEAVLIKHRAGGEK